MPDDLLTHEPAIRASAFAAVLLSCLALEWLRPRRRPSVPRAPRWRTNLGLILVDTVVVRLAFPFLAVGTAIAAEQAGLGLFNLIALPAAWEIVLAILALDLAIYAQHRLMHALPTMWRLHRVHHSDLEFDVTTGVRFHPVEMVASMAIKMAVVTMLGPAAIAVMLFEVLLNATSLFNHGNVRLPDRVDAALRLVVVTPDVHRIHHSPHRAETDSNFGFNFPWWDRLFGTYRAQPRDGHERMRIGLEDFRSPEDQGLGRLLLQPGLPVRGRPAQASMGGEPS